MTRVYEDILKEPGELAKSLIHTLGEGKAALEEAANILRKADHIYITGIGSSWHAGMAVQASFNAQGRPAFLFDASELLHFTEIASNAAVIMLSRSGKSIEIVQLLEKCRARQAKIIGITNTLDSPLAVSADVVLNLAARFDHQVSISMYSALTLVGSLLACETNRTITDSLVKELKDSLANAASSIEPWRKQFETSDWLSEVAPTYFLARGASVASCYEARLLWEEVAKAPATALTTGGFRHGPQEMVDMDVRIGLWLDQEKMRSQDLALANDLRQCGARVLLIGRSISSDAAELVINIPPVLSAWQFLIDIIPSQIAAERLARIRGKDCDSFRLCSYIVEDEGGLSSRPPISSAADQKEMAH